jgi:hypothetical protein
MLLLCFTTDLVKNSLSGFGALVQICADSIEEPHCPQGTLQRGLSVARYKPVCLSW